MSTFACEVVEIPGWENHPNADRLNITQVLGFTVIVRKGDYKVGDHAVYIPEGSVVDTDRPEFAFLKNGVDRRYERVKAMKLRGVYSEGLLIPANPDWQVGYDAKEELGVRKHEEVTPLFKGENERDPGFMPVFDVEPYQKYSRLLELGERVIVTEKLHGTNSRFGWKDDTLWVGSHNTFRRKTETPDVYWKTAEKLGLEDKFRNHGLNGFVLYGEVYGWVQDLRYGATPGETFFRAFAAYNSSNRSWVSYDSFRIICQMYDIPMVPVLYDGPYSPEAIESLRLGKTTVGGDHIREGIVIVPAIEREDMRLGRVALKYVSEDYKLRKNGTEHH